MTTPSKPVLRVPATLALLAELMHARNALKRSKGLAITRECPCMDALMVQLHSAVAAAAELPLQ